MFGWLGSAMQYCQYRGQLDTDRWRDRVFISARRCRAHAQSLQGAELVFTVDGSKVKNVNRSLPGLIYKSQKFGSTSPAG